MSVLLPAPFSPRSACISPGSTTRSMESLAVSEPKRLVIPRSSSFTDALRMVSLDTVARRSIVAQADSRGEPPCWYSPAPSENRSPDPHGSLRLARRGDLDLPRGDVLLDG